MAAVGFYREHVLPWLIDKGSGQSFLADWKQRTAGEASGRVLEIGFGPGGSLTHYATDGTVAMVVAVEPEAAMLRRAVPRIRSAPFPVVPVRAVAQRLPFADASFDAAVSILSMCSIEPIETALEEVKRVLRPGGRFHFLEHGRAHRLMAARWQRRLNPLQRRLCGCRLDLPVEQVLKESGLTLTVFERFKGPGPRLLAQMYLGTAVRDTGTGVVGTAGAG